jgi:hypothetical protein
VPFSFPVAQIERQSPALQRRFVRGGQLQHGPLLAIAKGLFCRVPCPPLLGVRKLARNNPSGNSTLFTS